MAQTTLSIRRSPGRSRSIPSAPDAQRLPLDRRASGRPSGRKGSFDGWGESVEDIAFHSQAHRRMPIMLGRPAIYDHIGEPALCSEQRKRGGRIHGQRGAERDDEIGFFRCCDGLLQILLAKALSEADGGRFEISPAAADRWLARLLEIIEMRLRIAALMTALAFHRAVGTVQIL